MNKIHKVISAKIAGCAAGKTKKQVRMGDLVDDLKDIRGAKFASLVLATEPKLKKTGNPYRGVTAISQVNVQLNYDYENAVNNQRTREGNNADFESGSTWYVPLLREDGTYTPFGQHKDNGDLYVRARLLQNIGETEYYDEEGNQIPIESLQPFMPVKKPSDRHGTEKEIHARTYKLSSVQAVTVDHTLYIMG